MCYQPITIKTPQGYKTVPCGHCLECLKKYQQDWSNRMYEELKSHNGKAVFFTLTYDDNNVPKNYLYYYDQSTYEIFRSPSDYGYDNTYTDEKGREKVLPSCKGERKHRRVAPDTVVKETLGVDTRVIDWNIKRKEENNFREKIQNIYGNYLRLMDNDNSIDLQDTISVSGDMANFEIFESSCGEFEDLDTLIEGFTEALNDDDFPEDDTNTDFRERPIMQFNSVRKKDVQDWIKRARSRRRREALKTGEPEQQFTFFVTSEYGPRTLRPHYHGVIFGLTAKESIDMRNDWIKHHGRRISWEDVDLSKGDMSYCSKYCSKGFYEHPLCAKNFFYPHELKTPDGEVIRPFTEYHSKHYERCIEIFNIDAPIVDPTFHLVSKGLGIDWVDDNSDLTNDFTDIQFVDDNTASTTVKIVRQCPLPWEDEYDAYVKKYGTDEDVKFEFTIDKNKDIDLKDYDECIKRLFDKFHYYRSFKGKTFAYGVPKYYRKKIFSDGVRCAFTNYVQQVNVEIYKEKFEQFRAAYPDGEDAEICSLIEREERQDKIRRACRIKKQLDRYYNKTKI